MTPAADFRAQFQTIGDLAGDFAWHPHFAFRLVGGRQLYTEADAKGRTIRIGYLATERNGIRPVVRYLADPTLAIELVPLDGNTTI